MGGVVFFGIGVEIAVAGTQHPLTVQTVTDAYIDALGLGRFQILVLTGLMRVVFHDILGWCLGVGNGDEGDHVFHLINIARHRHVQAPPVVFTTDGVVVGRLWVKPLVAQIEIGAVHVFHIAVVKFLGRRSLEALAPGGTQADVVANGEHA